MREEETLPAWLRERSSPGVGRFFVVLAVASSLVGWSDLGAAASQGEEVGDGLSVDQAVRTALKRTSYVERQEAMVSEMRAAKRATVRLPNPTFSYDREQWWQEGEVFAQDWFMLGHAFPLPGTRPARRRSAEAELQATRFEASRERRELAVEVRSVYYEVLAQRRRVKLTERWLERLRGVRETVRKGAREGRLSGRQVQEMTIEIESTRADLSAMRARLGRDEARLSQLIGSERGLGDRELRGTLQGSKVEVSVEEAVSRSRRRADLQALEANARAASAESTAARRSWLSEIALRGGYIRIGEPGLTAHGFAAGVDIPLPLFDRNRSEAKRASARRRRIENQLAIERRRLSARVRASSAAAKRKREAAARYRKRALAASEKLVERTEAAYEAGEATLFELLDAERARYEAELRAVDLSQEATRAELDLVGAIGGVSEEVSGE